MTIHTVVAVASQRVTSTLPAHGASRPRVASRRARRAMSTSGLSPLVSGIWASGGTRPRRNNATGVCPMNKRRIRLVYYVDQQCRFSGTSRPPSRPLDVHAPSQPTNLLLHRVSRARNSEAQGRIIQNRPLYILPWACRRASTSVVPLC